MTVTREEVFAMSPVTGPGSVALRDGNLYVGTSQSPDDYGVRELVSAASPASETLFDSTDEIIDPEYVVNFEGTLYALARTDQRVYTISAGGYTVWSDPLGSTAAWKPMFRPADGSCWVNYFDDTLHEFDATGSFVETHSFGSGSLGGGVWHNDLLYLADGGDDRIMVYDPSDDTLNAIISAVDFDYEFSVGDDLAIWNNRIFVSSGNTTGPIWSVALDGSDRQNEFADLTGSWLPVALNVINEFLYVSSPLDTDQRLWRLLGEAVPPSFVDPGPSSVRAHRYGRR